MADIEDTSKHDPFARIKQRAAEAEARLKQMPAQLPLWPEPVRGTPNAILRSALFGVIRKGRRRYLKAEQIAAVDGIEVSYTGERLDQGDLDVWLSLVHAVRCQKLGSRCHVTSYALLKLMGKTDTGKNRATLYERIMRLVATAVTIKQGRYTYIGSLIHWAAKDEATQEWVVELDPRLRELFAPDQYTQLQWAIRHELDGHQLAQWLHGFYSSHAEPYPVRIETLHRLSGSEVGETWKFTQMLRKALDAVAAASAKHGEQFSYEIRGDLVHVTKRPSRSQQRHLVKKAIQSRRTRA